MSSQLRALFFFGLMCSLLGCRNKSESEAVDLCFKEAPQVEGEIDESVKGTNRLNYKVRKIGSSNFLVEVDYQVVTMDNPNPRREDFWSIKTLTCEVKNGKIVDGSMLGSKSEQILRQHRANWPKK